MKIRLPSKHSVKYSLVKAKHHIGNFAEKIVVILSYEIRISKKFVHDWLIPSLLLLSCAGVAAHAFCGALAQAAGCGS